MLIVLKKCLYMWIVQVSVVVVRKTVGFGDVCENDTTAKHVEMSVITIELNFMERYLN